MKIETVIARVEVMVAELHDDQDRVDDPFDLDDGEWEFPVGYYIQVAWAIIDDLREVQAEQRKREELAATRAELAR